MAEFVLPPSIVANQVEWTLLDFSGVQQSPLSGAVRTISRGQRWQAHLLYHDQIDDERAALAALSARARGKANRIWVSDPAYKMRGSFPAVELLNNPAFNSMSGWTAYGGALNKAGNRECQVVSTSTANQGFQQSVTLNAAVAYVLRACLNDGAGTDGVLFMTQWANAGTSFLQQSTTLRGLFRIAGVSNAFAAWVVQPFVMLASGPLAAGDVGLCTYASMSRCALVVNPSGLTCFTSCLVDALPASTDGLLLAGDKVEINGEFKTVTADLNSASDGSGQLMFEPAMRVPIIPDNSPVVIFNPMMRGVVVEDLVQPSRPGNFLLSDFNFTIMEA